MQFWTIALLRIWTEIAHSDILKVGQKLLFDMSSGSEVQYFSLKLMITYKNAVLVDFQNVPMCSKIVLAKQIPDVIQNPLSNTFPDQNFPSSELATLTGLTYIEH